MSDRRQHRHITQRVADGGDFAQFDAEGAGVAREPDRLIARPKVLNLVAQNIGADPCAGTEAAREPGDGEVPGDRNDRCANASLRERFERLGNSGRYAYVSEMGAKRLEGPARYDRSWTGYAAKGSDPQ
jgi:hypothetical protein